MTAPANLLGAAEPWSPGTTTAPDAYETATSPVREEVSIRALVDEPAGFATMRRRIDATTLRRRRVRLIGHLRTERVTGWAALWMRVDDADGALLVRADTDDVAGTRPFTREALVLDVPAHAARLVFGCRLYGGGTIAARDFGLEVVGKRVAKTAIWLDGWHATGSAPHEYEMRPLDERGAGVIRARSDAPSGFGTIMRNIPAAPYRGRRVRFAAEVELEDVIGSAGLWMRSDDEAGKRLAFGSTQRPASGCMGPCMHEIVLDVPKGAARLFTGYALHGKGCIRARRIALSMVGQDVPTTASESRSGWSAAGTAPHAYVMTLLDEAGHGIIEARSPSPPGFATFTHVLDACPYRGRRARFRGRLRAHSVTGYAALWIRVDREDGKVLRFDSLERRAPIVGSLPFTEREIALDVPQDGARLLFGYLLHGGGTLEATDLAIEIVDTK